MMAIFVSGHNKLWLQLFTKTSISRLKMVLALEHITRYMDLYKHFAHSCYLDLELTVSQNVMLKVLPYRVNL